MERFVKYDFSTQNIPFYNCSASTASHIGVKNYTLGFAFLLYGILAEILYTLVLSVMYKLLRIHRIYMLMFALGIYDMIAISICSILTGYLYFVGATFCIYPDLIYVSGSVGETTWTGACLFSMVLVLNRVTDLWSGSWAEKIFGGWRMSIWVMIPIFYSSYFFLYAKPILFNSDQLSWFFSPMITKTEEESEHFYNFPHTVNNILVVLATCFLYIILWITLWFKYSKQSSVSSFQRSIILQSSVICFANLVASLVYVYMNFFYIPRWLILSGHAAWALGHGRNVILGDNKSFSQNSPDSEEDWETERGINCSQCYWKVLSSELTESVQMDSWYLFFGLFYAIVAIVGITGNLTMILAFIFEPQIPNTITLFQQQPMDQSTCFYIEFFPLVGALFGGPICFVLGIDRFTAVTFPHFYRWFQQHTFKALLLHSIIPIGFTSWILITAVNTSVETKITVCSPPSSISAQAFLLFSAASVILNILMLLVYFGVWIILKYRTTGNLFKRIFQSILITVTFIAFGWLATVAIGTYSISIKDDYTRGIVQQLAGVFVNLSLCTNVFVYYFRNSEYRDAIRRVLCLTSTEGSPLVSNGAVTVKV